MQATIKPNTISKEIGSIIECKDRSTHCYFRIEGNLKVFSIEDTVKYKIRDRIQLGILGTNISAIQYNVVCNEIRQDNETK